MLSFWILTSHQPPFPPNTSTTRNREPVFFFSSYFSVYIPFFFSHWFCVFQKLQTFAFFVFFLCLSSLFLFSLWSMEAKLLSASSPALPAVNFTTKFSTPSYLLTLQTREFPRFKFDCSARLSKKDQSARASTTSYGYKKSNPFDFFHCFSQFSF